MKVKALFVKPIDELIKEIWSSVGNNYKLAFVSVIFVNLFAFGFEMSNLTLHHDDIGQLLDQSKGLGQHVGRFGMGWLHYYMQGAYFMPFLQMVEGVIFMSLYGLLVAHLWGVRRTLDMILIASIMCVFPYMAQIYQYNTGVATYSLAHLLVALAVLLSIRATFVNVVVAAGLFMVAFSIYQTVIASAAVIFSVWLLSKFLFLDKEKRLEYKPLVKSSGTVLLSVVIGGSVYLLMISLVGLGYDPSQAGVDSYQSAGKAFNLGDGLNLSYAISEIAHGTRSFFFWPTHYFPYYLKLIQLFFVAVAGILCVWFAKGSVSRGLIVLIFSLTMFLPRILQLLHAEGHYHELTLTGYAVVVAGMVMLVNRAGGVLVRNFSCILAGILIFGYVVQCNWISSVNKLNMLAHYSTMTQILTRIKSLPNEERIDSAVYVVGKHYRMNTDYPFKGATGVATQFIDAGHMQSLAKLLREDIKFVGAKSSDTEIMQYAQQNSPWPHSSSVGMVEGVGAVVVLSKNVEK